MFLFRQQQYRTDKKKVVVVLYCTYIHHNAGGDEGWFIRQEGRNGLSKKDFGFEFLGEGGDNFPKIIAPKKTKKKPPLPEIHCPTSVFLPPSSFLIPLLKNKIKKNYSNSNPFQNLLYIYWSNLAHFSFSFSPYKVNPCPAFFFLLLTYFWMH